MSEDVSGRLLQLAEQLEEEASALGLRAALGLDAGGSGEAYLQLGRSAGRLVAAERLRALAAELFEPEPAPTEHCEHKWESLPHLHPLSASHRCQREAGHADAHVCACIHDNTERPASSMLPAGDTAGAGA